MHLLHFLSSFYYQAQEIASVSFSLIKKWKSISLFFFSPPYFFLHFFHAEECVMNELCLCEVVEIHFVVSSMDFCAGRSLMSLHVFSFCVCELLCVRALLPNYVCESIFSSLCVFVCISVCSLRCMSCVTSQWVCQWNTFDHTCSDMDDSVVGTNIIKHRQVCHLKG